ncbi:hypothetical protein NQ176_g4621 [Zarea fungicola]|uniref:Uncharacterized protein n=1 Tax=Zarea fungicola TaxID=93591 RepID=A0ACC1NDK8_9HYPO|nr:hypothetical protein NQ176_g4621 [Lecanicillium fungicola]
MKFSAQLLVAFLSTGALAGVAPRALSDFQAAMTDVQTKTDALDTAINAFTGGSTTPVQTAANNLVSTLNSRNAILSPLPVLSLADTFTLNNQVTSFKTHAQTLVNDLIAKRPVVISSSNCALVRSNIVTIRGAATPFINTLVAHADPAATSIAQAQANAIQAILQQGQDAYNTTNCP